jgi:hypothetical protein
MFENTLKDLQDCVYRMEEAESMEDLDINNYEKHAFYAMWRVCRDFMAEHERLLVEQGVTNE